MLLFSLSSCQKRTCSIAAHNSKNKLKPQQNTRARTDLLLTYFTVSQEKMSPVNGSSLRETNILSEDVALFHFYVSPSRILPSMKQFKGRQQKVCCSKVQQMDLSHIRTSSVKTHMVKISLTSNTNTSITIVLMEDNTLYHWSLSFQVNFYKYKDYC